MPHKNPSCPKCGFTGGQSHVHFVKMLEVNYNLTNDRVEYGKAPFKCGVCGTEFTGWGQHNINTASQILARRKREQK